MTLTKRPRCRLRSRPINRAIQELLARESDGPAEVSVLLCDDEEMRRLNHAFRSVNGPTDVLSFRQDDVALTPEGRALLGDVVISHQAVKRQAREQGHDEETEAVLLALHGALHLLGHEDETRRGSAEMRRKAEETARSLGYEVRKAVNRV